MEAILQNILVNTYNPDKQLRAQAEEALKNFIFAEGIQPSRFSPAFAIPQVTSKEQLNSSPTRVSS